MPYHIDYLPAARKAIEKLPRRLQQRIIERIGTLSSNPRPTGCVKLTGQDAYRIRIGDYRVIYTIEDDKLIVLVIDVGHRRDVYRN
jgi:mRNA interferase RelE/StbE